MNLQNLIRALFRQSDNPREPWYPRSPFVRTTSREPVSPDQSLQIGAVWRSVNYISQTLAGMPWLIQQQVTPTHSKPLPEHPVTRVLNVKPNSEMTPFTWFEAMAQSLLLWGNGYSEIVRDAAGRVKELWFLTPDRVRMKRDETTGSLYYEISNQTKPNAYLEPRDMFHVRGLGYDGLLGYSVIAYAAQTLGASIAMDLHHGAFYGNNAAPGGILKYPRRLSRGAKDRLKESWNMFFRGASKSFSVAVLEEGTEFQQVMIPHKDAQFVESRDWTVVDICRWFGVPPHKVYDYRESIYSTAEVASREVVNDSILPWARRFEAEVNRKLLNDSFGRTFCKADIAELLRGDPKARGDYYETLTKIGAISINEIRTRENMDPIANGDVHLVAANNYLPLKTVVEGESPAAQRQQGINENVGNTPDEADESAEDTEEEEDTESTANMASKLSGTDWTALRNECGEAIAYLREVPKREQLLIDCKMDAA